MWFAALGNIQHNAWLVSFVDKILEGCQTVLEDLLDEPEIAAGEAITRVRANLYHYDFTRLDTEWARRIPGTKIVDGPHQVWTRNLVSQYLPPLEPNNPSLNTFLQQAGYGPSICVDDKDRCADVGHVAQVPCRVASSLRRWNRKSWLSSMVFLLCCVFECLDFSRRKRPKHEKTKLE